MNRPTTSGPASATLAAMLFDAAWEKRIAGRAELLTPAEMARADAAAARLGAHDLMQNAGRAVARAIRARFRPACTLVLCGRGNNGGDGYVAARLLQQGGWPVRLAALGPPRPGSDAAAAAARWRGPTVAFTPAEAGRAALVVDAVFGAGLAREVDGLAAAVLAACPVVVAVDVPSGLDGATGQIRGFAPQAALTVTFVRLKPGHLLFPGRTLCGEIVLADIGMAEAALAGLTRRTAIDGAWLWRLPALAPDGHKHDRGHVAIVGGTRMTGAARLAAEAARRAGAGLVTIVPYGAPSGAPSNAPSDAPAGDGVARAADIYRAGAPGVIVDEAKLADQLGNPRLKTWVCGPGLGPGPARDALRQLLAAGRQVVADADAFHGDPGQLAGCAVLTPHEGEFTRVFGPIGADRLHAVRAAAAATGAVVLLKGAATVIARPDGFAAINASAPPWLATAGAGDVLAGIVAGLLAQGMAAFDAAAAGAWAHGRAATLAGPGMLAEDISPRLAEVMSQATEPPFQGKMSRYLRSGR